MVDSEALTVHLAQLAPKLKQNFGNHQDTSSMVLSLGWCTQVNICLGIFLAEVHFLTTIDET